MNEKDNPRAALISAVLAATERHALKKIVCSKAEDSRILRVVLTQKKIAESEVLQAETFHDDNKVTHANLALNGTTIGDELHTLFGGFRQIDLISTVGTCEYRRSKSGTETIPGLSRWVNDLRGAESLPPTGNDKQKSYILDGSAPFLQYLGVSDKSGRIHDKKQSKFRQINKFLENIRDIESHLPKDGPIVVYDLCCGKSYLSFAVYHYFSVIKKREIRMIGMDLKEDVIAYCNHVATEVGFTGLHFCAGDIRTCEEKEHPHLVISLHACDTATDIVLEKAVAWRADVILSTPCCHHELHHTLVCPELAFIAEYSMLRQKFCDAATDALRLKYLEANGYDVAALELIDPEETPKNILLRAIRKTEDPARRLKMRAARESYEKAVAFLKQKP